MADEEYDFFAPQPKPVPRVKHSLFDVVPDAFSPRTLELTGDHRRVKKGSETSTPANEPADAESVTDEQMPVVEEKIAQYVVTEVEAEKWEGVRDKNSSVFVPRVQIIIT